MAVSKHKWSPQFSGQLGWNLLLVGLLLIVLARQSTTGPIPVVNLPSLVSPDSPSDGGISPSDAGIIQRFKHAVAVAERLKQLGLYEKTVCKQGWEIGSRWPTQTENVTGTMCEPWISRDMVQVLSKLVTPDMSGLEWSSGSSTLWLVLRLKSLVSIENSEQWMTSVVETIEKIPATGRAKWSWKVVSGTETGDPAFRSNYSRGEEKYAQNGRYYEEYAKYPATLGRKFDFISVDGRARPACFREAVRLLKPEGGILMLDNSNRKDYLAPQAELPRSWPTYDTIGPDKQRTTMWISCEKTCHLE